MKLLDDKLDKSKYTEDQKQIKLELQELRSGTSQHGESIIALNKEIQRLE